jgi:hypothetical protein
MRCKPRLLSANSTTFSLAMGSQKLGQPVRPGSGRARRRGRRHFWMGHRDIAPPVAGGHVRARTTARGPFSLLIRQRFLVEFHLDR